MNWLAGGVLYSMAYLAAGAYLRGNVQALLWLRIIALLVPPLTESSSLPCVAVMDGCQWLFWATVALGLSMTAIGIVGWTVDEVLLGRETSWLGWYTVFALFGAVAPLFALLAQPHRGARESITASTAVDIAGIAVITGFPYSHFVVGSDLAPLTSQNPSVPLVLLQEFQQFLVCAALTVAALAARGTTWGATYGRLAAGLIVSFTILTISDWGILQGLYIVRRRIRRDVDPAVCVLCVGSGVRAGFRRGGLHRHGSHGHPVTSLGGLWRSWRPPACRFRPPAHRAHRGRPGGVSRRVDGHHDIFGASAVRHGWRSKTPVHGRQTIGVCCWPRPQSTRMT
jgi:hypothetical protein